MRRRRPPVGYRWASSATTGTVRAVTRPPFIDKIAWSHLQDGRLLCARNHGRERFYLPGGKREQGESDLQTLVREVDEELTVTIEPGTAASVGVFEAPADGREDGLRVRMTCYTATHTGDIAPANEIAEVDWLTLADGHRVSAVDRLVMEHLRELAKLDD